MSQNHMLLRSMITALFKFTMESKQ